MRSRAAVCGIATALVIAVGGGTGYGATPTDKGNCVGNSNNGGAAGEGNSTNAGPGWGQVNKEFGQSNPGQNFARTCSPPG
jgi:hypothetical protein